MTAPIGGKFTVNGAAKLLAWMLPSAAVIYFVGNFLFTLGQSVQRNSDELSRINQRLCAIEHKLVPQIIDADCK